MISQEKTTFLMLGEAVIDMISMDIVNSLEDAHNFYRFAGGEVANLATNLSRLGFQVKLATCIGEDGFGRFLQGHFSSAGIDTSLVQINPNAPTTLIPISRQTKTPDFNIYRGADQHLSLNDDLLAAAQNAEVIHTSAFALSRDPCRNTILKIINENQKNGKVISLDPNYHPGVWPDQADFLTRLKEFLGLVTVTKPSLDDSVRIFGPGLEPADYLEKFLDLGPQIVVLTMGEAGVLVGTNQGERTHIRARKIGVVDVTGAGDAFWAGMLAGLVRSIPVVSAAKLGQAVAEHKIGVLGPIVEYLSWDQYQKHAEELLISDF